MRRAALIVLALAAGLFALIVIVVAVAFATVDAHTLVAPLQARVKSATGRDLAIAGPIKFGLSLKPKVIASDVTLSNAPWGRAPHMLRAQRIELQVALLPLLARRLELIELALFEPAIALETDAQGRGNWEFDVPAAAAAPSPAAEAAGAAAFALGDASLRNGSLTIRNGATGKPIEVAIDRLVVHASSGDAAIDAEFKGSIDNVALALAGNVRPSDASRPWQGPIALAVKGEIDGKPATLSARVDRQDRATLFDALDLAWGTFAVKGQVRVSADGNRRKYAFSLAAPAWSPADAAVAMGAALGVPAPKGAAPSAFLFSDRALPLEALKAFDAEGDLAVATLDFDGKHRLQAVTMKLVLLHGRLDIPTLHANGLGGTLQGRLAIDTAHAGAPGVALKLEGRDLDLAAILAAAGASRPLKGGKTTLTVDLAAHGASLHQWAASATGQATASVGATTLVNTKVDLDNVLDRLTQAVNPFREHDPSTELICAVIRLPLADGIARIDRSIAIETKKAGASASGTLDFRKETLDLTFRPKVRQGIPIDIPQIAELVRFSGPFAHPAVSVDAAASAMLVAKIGAAVGTGGLSILGTSILSGMVDGGSLCAAALSGPAARKSAEPARTGARAR